jgi:hypothetical protein
MDFTGNIDQSMSIILAYADKVEFFNVTLTQWVVLVISLPWVIFFLQKLWKTFLPDLEFDSVTDSDND